MSHVNSVDHPNIMNVNNKYIDTTIQNKFQFTVIDINHLRKTSKIYFVI